MMNTQTRKKGITSFCISYTNIEQYSLYDLTKDPAEAANTYMQDTEHGMMMHRILEQAVKESLAIKEELKGKCAAEEEEPAMLPDDMEALRALVYLD